MFITNLKSLIDSTFIYYKFFKNVNLLKNKNHVYQLPLRVWQSYGRFRRLDNFEYGTVFFFK